MGATLAGLQVSAAPKGPVVARFVMFSVAEPVLLMVIVWGRLVVPTLTRPKSLKVPIMEEIGENPVIS